VARFAALDGLGVRRPTVAASDGELDSTNDGLSESGRNRIGRIPPDQQGFRRPNRTDVTDEPDVYETGYWVAPKYVGQGMATEAANAAIRYAFGHLGYFDGNEPSRHIVERLGFQKLGVARRAATRCLDGNKLDRHEYILTSPDTLPELNVSWS
jgi:RimJ/RimL family protein N-acetyltransferase